MAKYKRLGKLNKDHLHQEYIVRRKSTYEICKQFSCKPATIRYWLQYYNIQLRSNQEALRGRQLSEDHKRNLSISHKGQVAWCKGKSLSEDHKRKLQLAKIGKCNGRDNPNWKGGITPLHVQLRTSHAGILWRKLVFTRDNWTCGKCRKRGARLNAHHILSFSKFPNLRFDIQNGITFCESCHRLFHSLHGRVNSSPKLVDDFVKVLA